MKKRKKRRKGPAAPDPNKFDDLRRFRYLRPDETFHYACVGCGDCCRNVEHGVMLEPFDLFRIAYCLRQNGETISGIDDVLLAYAELRTLGDVSYPVFMLKTRGSDKACLFLKDGRCSIHKDKPRACRLYPLGAWPNAGMDGFDYVLVSERPRHLCGPAIRAGEWMEENFQEEERRTVLSDAKSTMELVPLLHTLKRMVSDWEEILRPLILFRYLSYDLDKPFLPQFIRNAEQLKQILTGMAGEKDEHNG